MIQVFRFSMVLPFLFLFSYLKSQETLIKVPFSQPEELQLDAGDDVVLETGQTLVLGTDIIISGGSPEYQYKWNDNLGNEFSTLVISISEAGSYYLTVTDADHCTAVDSVAVARVSSIENKEPVTAFSVFPNPSAGLFWYHIIKPEDKDMLEVISADGKVVFKKELQSAPDDLTGLIDISGSGKGQYLVKLMRKGSNQAIAILIH